MSGPRILLTGAAGGIGTLLRRTLARKGEILRLNDIAPMGAAGPGEEMMQGDLADADFTHALPEVEFEEQKAALAAKLLDTERKEEAIIEKLTAQGTVVLRRKEASPAAILGLGPGARRRRAGAA